jgi:hypothetical protein
MEIKILKFVMKKNVLQYAVATVLFCMLFSFQIIKTQLRVTVLTDLGNASEGAMVKIFGNKEDYNNDKTATQPQLTDSKGKTIFYGLDKGPYILEVEKEDYSNSFGGQLTDTLSVGKINKINVIISK